VNNPNTSNDLDPTRLACYGCANSADGEPYPGKPSGERPCFFCVRNTERELWIARAGIHGKLAPLHPSNGVWYDSSFAVKVPMDCYRPLDMMDQMRAWAAGEQAFYEYLERGRQAGVIEWAVKIFGVRERGKLHIYLHPLGKDGETVDFIIGPNGLALIEKVTT
jgi:hypothetical protein